MSARAHLRLLLVATAVWLAFWLAGLPDYYLQYPARAMAAFETALLVPVALAGWIALRPRGRTSRRSRAVALAFWFTVPLFLYDLAYCGAWLGHGLGFVRTYWFLTTYYVVPWALFVPTALWLDRRDARGDPPRAPAG